MALGLNDVDVDGMKELDRKIRENPALGKRTVKLRSTWKRGVKALIEIGAQEVLSSGGLAKLSIVGTGMLGTPGIAGRMFRTLADHKINIEMISTSEIRITCLVDRKRAEDGVRALHSAFDLDVD